jgi:hypothetical protein
MQNNEKWSKEVGAKICDKLTVNPNLTQSAKIASGSPKLVFLWIRNSATDQRNDVPVEQSKYGIRWPVEDGKDAADVPLIYFHEAVIQAQRIFRLLAESQVRSLLASPESGGGGHLRQVLDGNGKPAFEVDPLRAAHALEYDDDLWKLTYGENARRDDVYARDERGALIPLKVRDPIPSQTLIHLIRSLFGDTYNPSDRKEVDSKHSVEVLVLGEKSKGKPLSNLRADLEARLAAIRSNPDRASAKPTGPVAMIGHGNNDPPEHVSSSADDAPATLADHPRAYFAPTPSAPRPAPNYAKPNKSLDQSGTGRGVPPTGGHRVA